jgi:hypothetical protein
MYKNKIFSYQRCEPLSLPALYADSRNARLGGAKAIGGGSGMMSGSGWVAVVAFDRADQCGHFSIKIAVAVRVLNRQ